MQLSQLRAAQPDLVRSGATELDRVSAGLEDAADRIESSVRRPLADGAWSGEASKAAFAHIDGVRQRLTDTADAVSKAGQGVRLFADTLAEARQLVARADQIAEQQRFKIGDDGSITFPDTEQASPAESQATRAAGAEAHDLLGRALTMASDADDACARTLSEAGAAGAMNVADAAAARQVGALAGAAAAAHGSGGENSGGGFGDTLHDLFFGEGNFDDSMLGDAVSDWSQGDRSIMERVWLDPDGSTDLFDLTPWEEEFIAATPLEASPSEILGEEVVDTIHEEGVAAGPRAWWDQSWEDMSNVPDRIGDGIDSLREGVEDFADNPVDTVVGMFT